MPDCCFNCEHCDAPGGTHLFCLRTQDGRIRLVKENNVCEFHSRDEYTKHIIFNLGKVERLAA